MGVNLLHANSQKIAFREVAEVYRSFDYPCIKRIYAKEEEERSISGLGQYLLISHNFSRFSPLCLSVSFALSLSLAKDFQRCKVKMFIVVLRARITHRLFTATERNEGELFYTEITPVNRVLRLVVIRNVQ